MKFLKKIEFKDSTTETDSLEFYGEFVREGLEHYVTYQEIKSEIIKEIIKRLEDDINLKVEALKPEIAQEIINKSKTNKNE